MDHSCVLDRDAIIRDLETKGYAVVPNVVPTEDCDSYTQQFKDWLSKFGDGKPFSYDSLMHFYRVAHFDAVWRVRLQSKPVFASVWKTEKLLSSMDGISIGEPPEYGRGPFRRVGTNWFHLDQGRSRHGLHVYQGAVYLEETTEEDYCLRVLEKSHLHHSEVSDVFPEALVLDDEENGEEHFRFQAEWLEWYKTKGCREQIIAVPKGGMVLWDSRTVHDAVLPLKGRAQSDRWRSVVFVCMAPAIWAAEKDYQTKKIAYDTLVGTAHWPVQKCHAFESTTESPHTKHLPQIYAVDTMPDIAVTKEVKLMAGLERYDFGDGSTNDPGWKPSWDKSSVHYTKYN